MWKPDKLPAWLTTAHRENTTSFPRADPGRTTIGTTQPTRAGRSRGGASHPARSLENRQLVTKREDLRLQGGTGSKLGNWGLPVRKERKESSSRYHHDLTNDWNLRVFRSDGVFSSTSSSEPQRYCNYLIIRGYPPAPRKHGFGDSFRLDTDRHRT
jgi:hypothetical protein